MVHQSKFFKNNMITWQLHVSSSYWIPFSLIESTMKLAIVLLSILFTCCNARLQLSRQSYMKFPYQYTNGDPTSPRYGLFQNAAHKAAFHTVDKILYVACKLFSFANCDFYMMNLILQWTCIYSKYMYSCAISTEIPPHHWHEQPRRPHHLDDTRVRKHGWWTYYSVGRMLRHHRRGSLRRGPRWGGSHRTLHPVQQSGSSIYPYAQNHR